MAVIVEFRIEGPLAWLDLPFLSYRNPFQPHRSAVGRLSLVLALI